MGGLTAAPAKLELHSSRRGGSPTLSEDTPDSIVFLISVVVVPVGLMGGLVQGHMFLTDVGLTGAELTLMSLPELSGAHLDAVGVLNNPADQLPGCE